MTHSEFSRLLAGGGLPSVLFFEGPEEHLKQQALADLRKALLPEGLEEMNETRLDSPETDALIAAAETLPFLADRRLILLRDPAAVVGRAEADDRLLEYLPKVPPTAVIVFYIVQPVKQKKIKNAVTKLGGLVQFKPLAGAELTSFVTSAFHDLGRECDARTADYLIFTCGADSGRLLTEIAKIAALHPEEPRVSPEDVQALATPSTESTVFRITDAVVAGKDAEAFRLLRFLLQGGEQRMMVLAMLMRQFRLLQHVKIMQYERLSPARIAQALGLSSYSAQQYIRQAALFTGGQVKQAVSLCLDTDLAVKSGQLRDEGALEALMLKLLQLRKNEKDLPK